MIKIDRHSNMIFFTIRGSGDETGVIERVCYQKVRVRVEALES